MSRENDGNSSAVAVAEEGPAIGSPPAAAAPERKEYDPRVRLHELVLELTRSYNRRLMLEYLRLRRAAR